MHTLGSLQQFIEFVRSHQGISRKVEITSSSLLEKDLRITGDDGDELLSAIQDRYGISFIGKDGSIKDAFGLEPGQFLFRSEPNIFHLLASLLGADPEFSKVKPIAVGDLYAIIEGLQNRIDES